MMYNVFMSVLLTLPYFLPELPSFYGLFIFYAEKTAGFTLRFALFKLQLIALGSHPAKASLV